MRLRAIERADILGVYAEGHISKRDFMTFLRVMHPSIIYEHFRKRPEHTHIIYEDPQGHPEEVPITILRVLNRNQHFYKMYNHGIYEKIPEHWQPVFTFVLEDLTVEEITDPERLNVLKGISY